LAADVDAGFVFDWAALAFFALAGLAAFFAAFCGFFDIQIVLCEDPVGVRQPGVVDAVRATRNDVMRAAEYEFWRGWVTHRPPARLAGQLKDADPAHTGDFSIHPGESLRQRHRLIGWQHRLGLGSVL
jgi:hypothetical protein